MANWRLFIAIELPPPVRDVLAAVQRELAAAGADVKWSPPENIHLTLKFLGDTPDSEIRQLAETLNVVARQGAAHLCRLGNVGAFPDMRRPRVIWVGLDEPTGELVALQQRIDEATADLVGSDPRGFTPHLTLGRTRSGRNAEGLAAMLDGYQFTSQLDIPVSEVLLMSSVLGRGGPTYATLHRSPLR
jgi:RNA 2',3'-cyclic 3'-phosphodiesterase